MCQWMDPDVKRSRWKDVKGEKRERRKNEAKGAAAPEANKMLTLGGWDLRRGPQRVVVVVTVAPSHRRSLVPAWGSFSGPGRRPQKHPRTSHARWKDWGQDAASILVINDGEADGAGAGAGDGAGEAAGERYVSSCVHRMAVTLLREERSVARPWLFYYISVHPNHGRWPIHPSPLPSRVGEGVSEGSGLVGSGLLVPPPLQA